MQRVVEKVSGILLLAIVFSGIFAATNILCKKSQKGWLAYVVKAFA
jgi:hypothetical protein